MYTKRSNFNLNDNLNDKKHSTILISMNDKKHSTMIKNNSTIQGLLGNKLQVSMQFSRPTFRAMKGLGSLKAISRTQRSSLFTQYKSTYNTNPFTNVQTTGACYTTYVGNFVSSQTDGQGTDKGPSCLRTDKEVDMAALNKLCDLDVLFEDSFKRQEKERKIKEKSKEGTCMLQSSPGVKFLPAGEVGRFNFEGVCEGFLEGQKQLSKLSSPGVLFVNDDDVEDNTGKKTQNSDSTDAEDTTAEEESVDSLQNTHGSFLFLRYPTVVKTDKDVVAGFASQKAFAGKCEKSTSKKTQKVDLPVYECTSEKISAEFWIVGDWVQDDYLSGRVDSEKRKVDPMLLIHRKNPDYRNADPSALQKSLKPVDAPTAGHKTPSTVTVRLTNESKEDYLLSKHSGIRVRFCGFPKGRQLEERVSEGDESDPQERILEGDESNLSGEGCSEGIEKLSFPYVAEKPLLGKVIVECLGTAGVELPSVLASAPK